MVSLISRQISHQIRKIQNMPLLKISFTFLFSFFFLQNNPTDARIFQQKMQLPQEKSLTATLMTMAHSFEGTPYVSNTLEKEGEEALVINLRELDCVTFIENALALALTKQKSGNFEQYKQFLTQLRYRNGRINGYASRLHYFTDALHEAQKNGYLTDVTQKTGGIPYKKTISAMSSNPSSLKNPQEIQQIIAAEADINQRKMYFIPKNNLRAAEKLIQTGDIIATTAAAKGLDVTHTGFAVVKKGRVHFLHASYNLKKVMLTAEPLVEYMANKKSQSGVMLYRIAQ
jgi:Protein of unknown function (DUF1460)